MSTPRVRGQRAGLSRDLVLDAAREIAERDGLERLSLRRLAGALGVAPNAIYSHVASKDALLDELLDRLLGDLRLPVGESDWRSGLTELLCAFRRLMLSHPSLVPLFLARPSRGANGLRLREGTFALLARGGLRGAPAVEAFRALVIFTLGSAAFEASRLVDPDPETRWALGEAAFAGAEEFPYVRDLAPLLARPPDERSFRAGLAWLLAGMAAPAGRSIGEG